MTLAIAVVLLAAAFHQIGAASRNLEEILSEHVEQRLEVERIAVARAHLGRTARYYLETGEPQHREQLQEARQEFGASLAALGARAEAGETQAGLEALRDAGDRYVQAIQGALASRAVTEWSLDTYEDQVGPVRDQLDRAVASLRQIERRAYQQARDAARASARSSLQILLGTSAAALALVGVLASMLMRSLTRLERSRADRDSSITRLENANRDLDAFAGRIAHDLANILAPLSLTAARLRRARDPRELAQSSADKIVQVARRANGLIESLLAFSRAGQPPDLATSTPVAQVVADALEDLDQLKALAEAEVLVEIEAGTNVRCAASLLHTVVLNLVSNAFKSLQDQPKREVRISAHRLGSISEISVADTGPGIPEEAQQRIFEPFYRGPLSRGPGTGIGLATVKRIVDAYEGRLSIRSRVGEGTTFVLRMPAGEAPPQAASDRSAAG
jgi:signal transduction histidine kinase